jgi:hypothetical protein
VANRVGARQPVLTIARAASRSYVAARIVVPVDRGLVWKRPRFRFAAVLPG